MGHNDNDKRARECVAKTVIQESQNSDGKCLGYTNYQEQGYRFGFVIQESQNTGHKGMCGHGRASDGMA